MQLLGSWGSLERSFWLCSKCVSFKLTQNDSLLLELEALSNHLVQPSSCGIEPSVRMLSKIQPSGGPRLWYMFYLSRIPPALLCVLCMRASTSFHCSATSQFPVVDFRLVTPWGLALESDPQLPCAWGLAQSRCWKQARNQFVCTCRQTFLQEDNPGHSHFKMLSL